VYLLALVAASLAAHGRSRSLPTVASLAITTGVLVDLLRSAKAHGRARDLVCVAAVHDAYAVSALCAALRAEGIDARPRGMAVLSLLQAFGAYAPAEIYVRAGDAERASALLRHWAAGEAKPVASATGARAGNTRAPWSPGLRAAVIAGLGGAAVVVGLSPRGGQEPPPAKRAEIAIVRVNDDVDPLRSAHLDEAPEGVSLYTEIVPLGKDRSERREYARVTLGDGESLDQAWARLLPWLEQFQLPPGERWGWEEVSEPVTPSEGESGPIGFRVVGLRTLVLTGDPVVTTADVESADVGLEKDTQNAYVLVTLSPAGGERFFRVTEEWLGRRLAIVVNGRVDSAPVIRSPIRGGRLTITMGNAMPDEQLASAKRLAASLR
jgi:hypothetical protein